MSLSNSQNNQLKGAINAFYRDEFQIKRPTVTKDAEGGRVVQSVTVIETVNGSVQPASHELIVELKGQGIKAEMSITAPAYTQVQEADTITHDGQDYNVTSVLKYQSHTLIIAAKES